MIFKTFHTAYSKSLKRICGFPDYYSNHFVAVFCSQLLLRQHVNLDQIKFLKRIYMTKNPLFILNNFYLRSGLFTTSVFKNFKSIYNINIFSNNLDAIQSRIFYLQSHE